MANFNIGVNGQKFVLLVMGMTAVVVLLIMNTIEWDAGGPILSGIVFYAIGDGVNSVQGKGTRSVFEPKEKSE